MAITALAPAATSKAAIAAITAAGFTSGLADVNGTTLHYVRGGSGPAIILIPGFPQDWSVYRAVMPKLAEQFTVVAVDIRGIGLSKATDTGYDNETGGRDIDALARHLRLDDVFVVGHDMGGSVAYGYARQFAGSLRGVMLLDVPIPGLAPWELAKGDPHQWHFAFHQMPNQLAETMISGRQVPYFRSFFDARMVDRSAITDDDVARYAEAYSSAASLRAGMAYYRAFPQLEVFNAAQKARFDPPVILAGGDQSFAPLLGAMADDLKVHGCQQVHVEVVQKSGHFVLEDQPEQVLALIEKYAAL